jgi:hypothetical protein
LRLADADDVELPVAVFDELVDRLRLRAIVADFDERERGVLDAGVRDPRADTAADG